MALPNLGWLGSRPAGMAFNAIGSWLDNRWFDKNTRPQINALNEAAQGGLDRAGFNASYGDLGGQALGLSTQANRLANQGFNPQAIQGRFDDAFGGINAGLGQLPETTRIANANTLTQFGRNAAGITSGFGAGAQNIQAGLTGLTSDVNRGYADRLATARGLVGQYSNQDVLDTNKRFADEQSAAAGDLRSRGYGGSSIATATRGVIGDRLSGELNRVSDNRLNRALGVESQFGGEALQAQERLGMAGAQTGLGLLQAGTNLQTGLASTGLSARLNASAANADTALGAYGQQAGIAGTGFDAQTQAYLNRLGVLNDFGKYGIDTQYNVFDRGMGYYNQPIITQRPGFQQAQIQPYGGRGNG